MLKNPCLLLATVGLFGVLGCGSGANQPEFAPLHPVTGVVKRSGQPVKGGQVRFAPEPDKSEFMIVCEVQPDGTYTLATVRSTDKRGERKTGVPEGTYRVTFTPHLEDQTAGSMEPITLPKLVVVVAGQNDIPIDLPVGKK